MTPSPSMVAFRFGLGLPLPDAAPRSPQALLETLTGPDTMQTRWPVPGLDAVLPLMRELRRAKEAKKRDPAKADELKPLQVALADMAALGQRHSFARLLDASDGLRERLVAFWADHFTTAGGAEAQLLINAMIDEAIRPNLTAPFAQMLVAVTTHPAMLNYLDQVRSIGPNSVMGQKKGQGLNENHARELLELHTMGVGAGYGQDDVRQLAELMTGLSYDQRRGYTFDARKAEPGPETVLGIRYDGKGAEPLMRALHDIALRPETARHIARKLVVHFIDDQPEEGLVEALAGAWAETGGNLLAVYGALLQHPAAWEGPARKARQPWEFIFAALRALGVTGETLVAWEHPILLATVLQPLRVMGQPWKAARGPDGWPEEIAAWISPQGLAARIEWAMTRPSRIARPLPLPTEVLAAALGDRAGEAVTRAAERAEDREEGVGLIFASPEFNRR